MSSSREVTSLIKPLFHCRRGGLIRDIYIYNSWILLLSRCIYWNSTINDSKIFFFYFITYLVLFSSISICAKYKSVLPYITGTCGITTPLFNLLFTSLFSIKFLYFFIISSLFTYFNLFVSIFIQSYVNINLQMYMFRPYIYSYPGLYIYIDFCTLIKAQSYLW
jgi:hypothetical protein